MELAQFQGVHGSVTSSFARRGRELIHGNQLIAGKVFGYNPERRFRNDHTLENIWRALDGSLPRASASNSAKRRFAGYLFLDALIGNTDRHHENWGVLRRGVSERWESFLAPSFDHASSLGRELADRGPGRTREFEPLVG